MAVQNEEARAERARNMGQLNGLGMVLVTLQPVGGNPVLAQLEVTLINDNEVAAILADVGANPDRASEIFPITGGFRVPAGSGPGEVKTTGVTAGAAANVLLLAVEPIGDYSTYTLGLAFQNIDPVFRQIEFRFRPGCFTTNCAPAFCMPRPPAEPIAIDYLARDFDSFRHTLISAMIERVPAWRPSSEADLDQVLIELMSGAADELADYQDRVMNEAYLGTARKRVSLARHSRLIDYFIHEGNQASTWIALTVESPQPGLVPDGLAVWAGRTEIPESPAWPRPAASAQVFVTKEDVHVDRLLNRIQLYTWSGTTTRLDAGTTCADLDVNAPDEVAANTIRDDIRNGLVPHLLIQEHRDPLTCREAGADPTKRQLLTLVPASAESIHDPDPTDPTDLTKGTWLVHVCWEEKLERTYCFSGSCPDQLPDVDDISLFHGNLAQVVHGWPRTHEFLPPGALLDPVKPQSHYVIPPLDMCNDRSSCPGFPATVFHRGIRCVLPEDDLPLAYRNGLPGGAQPSLSTLQVEMVRQNQHTPMTEQPTLVYSDELADDFMVETDEYGHSVIVCGNGVNARSIPDDATLTCAYQAGFPLQGNVGRDSIMDLDRHHDFLLLEKATVWNPFDVTDGRAPESPEVIIRRAPEAYRSRQLRAVTLQDYVHRAEEIPGVSRAAARYAWTGSWRTVQITIDPVGVTTVSPALRQTVMQHLDAVRLIGEDLEIRPPRFVPLDIDIAICIDAGTWPADMRFELEEELSDGYTRDGRPGFFHPDRWTFGQELHASELIGRIQAVPGVDHVESIVMRRWDAPTPGTDAIISMAPNEIIQVRNDPDHMEQGMIRLNLKGGRR
jgi:hypothetical protein